MMFAHKWRSFGPGQPLLMANKLISQRKPPPSPAAGPAAMRPTCSRARERPHPWRQS